MDIPPTRAELCAIIADLALQLAAAATLIEALDKQAGSHMGDGMLHEIERRLKACRAILRRDQRAQQES